MTHPTGTVDTDLACPRCQAVYGVHGSVFQVVDENGVVLWQRCKCGAIVPIGEAVQPRLFGRAACGETERSNRGVRSSRWSG